MEEKLRIWESLTLSNGFIFSNVMRNKEICIETLEIILRKKIKDIKYIDNQRFIDKNAKIKSTRVDVYVDGEENIISVDMLIASSDIPPERSTYYQELMDLNAIYGEGFFGDFNESAVIFICTYDPFQKGLPRYTFKLALRENPDICLNDGTTKIFLVPENFMNEKNENEKSFLSYLENGNTDSNIFLEKLDNAVKSVKENLEFRDEYLKIK